MNTDVENLLREGMERFTRDLRAPAGLTRRVARRRRRRLALRSAAGAAAALAAGAVALVAVVVPGVPDSSAAATAYVVKRVDGALSAAEPGSIAQMTVTTRSAVIYGGTIVTTTAEEWSHGGQWRSVKYSPAGRPVYDEGSGTSSLYTLVSYLTRTWARQRLPSPPVAWSRAAVTGPRGCGPRLAPVPFVFQSGLPGIGFSASSLPTTVARDLRAAISCGTLADRPAARRRDRGSQADQPPGQPDHRDHLGQPGHLPAAARGYPLGRAPWRVDRREPESPAADRGHHLAPADRAEPGPAHRAHPRPIPSRPAPRGRYADLAADPGDRPFPSVFTSGLGAVRLTDRHRAGRMQRRFQLPAHRQPGDEQRQRRRELRDHRELGPGGPGRPEDRFHGRPERWGRVLRAW